MRRGLYEIFTTFFFLLVLLIALFFWLTLSGDVTLIKSQTSEQRLKTSLAREAYDTVARCNGGMILDEARIEDCRAPGRYVKEVMVDQPPIDGCPQKRWGEAGYLLATRDTGVNVFPYWVSVKQMEGARVCLAQLLVVI